MLTNQQLNLFINAFPRFKEDRILLKNIQENGTFAEFPADKILCHDGQYSSALPMVISGLIRVYKVSESGKEISLYHIVDGESCVLTAASILGSSKFPAIAASENSIEVVMLPATSVNNWLIQSPDWQHFIFELIAQRMTEVITVVEEVAFQRMDRRIANYLNIKSIGRKGDINITHQAIAAEIGTAREVVTRVLRDLERKEVLELTRGNIKIINIVKLEELL